jgi:SAM-dependent methyltransferase
MSRSAAPAGAIDWRWTNDAVVPAYYERAFAPLRALPRSGARLLELGVGCGYVLSKLVRQSGGRAVGIDDDAGALRLSRQVSATLGANLALVRGRGQALPFPDEIFDMVFSQGLIEHFPPDVADALVAEHVRVLRRGGVLAISVPNLYNPFHTWLKWREGSSYRFHPERSYRPRALKELLTRHGIGVEGVDGYGLFWSLWHQRSRLAYYASAITIRLGLGQEFETHLPAWLRARLCMMTLAWGHRR